MGQSQSRRNRVTAERRGPAIRIAFVALLLAPIVALALGTGRDTSAEAAPEEPRNVVVIMTDDQTAESLRVMDETKAALADQGARFTNSFVNLPLCCPSRSTFLTGLYAHNHDITTNESPLGGFYKFDADYGQSNLATWLSDAGYHTALVGKYLNEYGARPGTETAIPAGWSEWHATLEPNPEAYGYSLNENGAIVDYGTAVEDYKGDVLTGKAVEVIEAQALAPAPFFLWLSYTQPHGGGPNPSPQPPANCDPGAKPAARHATAFDTEPLPQPPSFDEEDVSDKPPSIQDEPRFDSAAVNTLRQRYRCSLEALLSVDEGVGDVVGALSESGELDNTLIVFTSDNGFFYGEHRLDQGKGKHYEPSTRVPLLIRGPGVPAGQAFEQLVINADLAPTILDATGVQAPIEPDGLSLLPLLGAPESWQRQTLLIENRTYAGARDDRYKYVEFTSGQDAGAIELYDLVADPDELQNLHGDPSYATIESQLAEHLSRLRACAGATCHPAPPPGPADPGPTTPTDPPPARGDTDPPETTITKRPASRVTGRKVRFEFISDERGSSFECRIDKRPFRPCDSAGVEKLKVREGRHTFRVLATDSADNTDPTADKAAFRVLG